jgi:hypothetical protein
MREGRLVADTSPSGARAAVDGTIFEGDVHAEDFDALRASRRVIKSYLVEGRNRVRLFEPDGDAPRGFMPVPPTLEDFYLVLTHAREVHDRIRSVAPRPVPLTAAEIDAR